MQTIGVSITHCTFMCFIAYWSQNCTMLMWHLCQFSSVPQGRVPRVGVASPTFPTSPGRGLQGDVSPLPLFGEMRGDATAQGGGRVSPKGGLVDIPPNIFA
jgi:hypothetical protein